MRVSDTRRFLVIESVTRFYWFDHPAEQDHVLVLSTASVL